MKNFTLLISLLVIVCLEAFSQSVQQSVINASGGSHEIEDYSYEWSIGELVLVNEMVEKDGKYMLTNGFLQPYSFNGKPITPATFKGHEIRMLHNPVKSDFAVQLTTNESGKFRLKVYDERGYTKYANELNVSAGVTTQTISMTNCASGNYFLKAEFISNDLSKKHKEGTFKFLKIH